MDAWICPRCGPPGRGASVIRARCFYGRCEQLRREGAAGPEPGLPAAASPPPRVGAPEPGQLSDPTSSSSPVKPPLPGPVARAAGRREPVAGAMRRMWAAWASLGVLAAALGLGWWWGAGQSRPLARDLASAQATIQRLEARAPRTVTRTVTRTVAVARTADGAGWHQSGIYNPADPITLSVVLGNPLTGRTLHTTAIGDTGSYVSLISQAIAHQLGLQRVSSGLISGVGGPVSNALMSGIDIADPQGQVLFRLGSVQTMSDAIGTMLLGRDVLDLPGVTLTTGGDQWALTLPTTGQPAEGGPDILTAHGPVAPPANPGAPAPSTPTSTAPAPNSSSAWPPPGASPPQPFPQCPDGCAVTWPNAGGGSTTRCTTAQGVQTG